ncbi:neural cell adhesion molecule 1 isoform X1 [Esox lucius]|uniref:Neural cell adhesion molecule 3 n=1 Tax=Esox lucius TaxID=8010 RepID=A0A3P9ALH5_ESOLU|nr:neural cell adhesion molecule 1 isoform X1 [Esox lucius]
MAELMLILRMFTIMLILGFSEARMEILSNQADVPLGENHVLLCKAGGEGKISWKKDGEDLDKDGENPRIEEIDETSSKLTIVKAKIEDSGRYLCLCEFETDHRDETFIILFVYEKPAFIDIETYHEFLEGQDAVIPCNVTGQPAVEVKWKRYHQELQPNDRIRITEENSVQIKNISREDQGTYICEGKIKQRPISKETEISIVVNVSPIVKIHEEVKKVKAGPETNVSLICLVEGVPKPNITWKIPDTSDESRYKYNSDKSELTILSVVRHDYGPYTCVAKSKIGESSATIMLDVSEHPLAVLNQTEMEVESGQTISVSCNVSGHPMPTLQWFRKTTNGSLLTVDAGEGRMRLEDDYVLVIDDLTPSDGGLYTCMAISPAGNASTDLVLKTRPGKVCKVSAAPGPTSVHFTLGAPLVDGGSTITNFILQWRLESEQHWQDRLIQPTDPLVITSLVPYTSYLVRLATQNAVGPGEFSDQFTIRTQGIQGEPDKPVLVTSEGKVDGNMFSIPLTQMDDGGSPIINYIVHYRNMVDEDWRMKKLPSNLTTINLHDLQYNSEYQMEVQAVNLNGSSSPVKLNFKVPQPVPAERVSKSGIGKGAVVGIVVFIFFILLLAVDVTCCYTNRCGMLMFLAVKLFGQKVPGRKTVEEGHGTSNGDLKLNGIDILRNSIPNLQTQNETKNKLQAEVTCDQAPLTKFEKTPHNGDPDIEA